MRIDHVAHPSRDAAETHRFYTEVLGLPLVQAYGGTELMLVYALPGGGSLVFSAEHRGPRSPDEGVAWERRHVGLTVATRAELDGWLKRLEDRGIRHQLIDNERVYFSDPDGLVLELEVASSLPVDPTASKVLADWLSRL